MDSVPCRPCTGTTESPTPRLDDWETERQVYTQVRAVSCMTILAFWLVAKIKKKKKKKKKKRMGRMTGKKDDQVIR